MFRKIRKQFLFNWMTILVLSFIVLRSGMANTPATSSEITVHADYMVYSLNTGENIYQGNVRIIQGSIELTGDSVTVKRIDNKISNIQVKGNPARYLQDENTDNIVRATSQQIDYSASKNRLTLIDQASLEQSDHTVNSERITYDTVKKAIIAGRSNTKKQDDRRVNITLTPAKKNHDNQKQPGN